MEKEERYYLNTCIWLDFFEERDEKGERARKLIKNIVRKEGIILYSNLHMKELKNAGYNYDEIIEMFGIVRGNYS